MLANDHDCVAFVEEHYDGIHKALIEQVPGLPRAPAVCCEMAVMATIVKAAEEELSIPNYSELEPADRAAVTIVFLRRGMESFANETVDRLIADVFKEPDA